jgi:hypothetical protein
VEANLINLPVQLENDETCCLSVICAVCEDANEDLILLSNVVEHLVASKHQKLVCTNGDSNDVEYGVINVTDLDECQIASVYDVETDSRLVAMLLIRI